MGNAELIEGPVGRKRRWEELSIYCVDSEFSSFLVPTCEAVVKSNCEYPMGVEVISEENEGKSRSTVQPTAPEGLLVQVGLLRNWSR